MGERNERIEILWSEAETLVPGERNRLALGRVFDELRRLYSERSPADVRLSCGHGTFENEIVKRGFKPRTVRGWISDYQAHLTGKASASQKRRTSRESRKLIDGLYGIHEDPRLEFVKLLPFRAAQLAYRDAAILFHPDRGGNTAKMQRLNVAWERAKDHFRKE